MTQVLHVSKNDKYSKFWVEDYLKGDDDVSNYNFKMPLKNRTSGAKIHERDVFKIAATQSTSSERKRVNN